MYSVAMPPMGQKYHPASPACCRQSS